MLYDTRRFRGAILTLFLTHWPSPSEWANTDEALDSILTGTLIQTWIAGTRLTGCQSQKINKNNYNSADIKKASWTQLFYLIYRDKIEFLNFVIKIYKMETRNTILHG